VAASHAYVNTYSTCTVPEYGIHIRVAASQEYVNTYSTCTVPEYGIHIRVAASQEYVDTYSPCRVRATTRGVAVQTGRGNTKNGGRSRPERNVLLRVRVNPSRAAEI